MAYGMELWGWEEKDELEKIMLELVTAGRFSNYISEPQDM